MNVKVSSDGIHQLERSWETAEALGGVADDIAGTVRAPSSQRISTRHGVSRRGAFSQILMVGPGAIVIEFGGKRRAALKPLRSALARRRR